MTVSAALFHLAMVVGYWREDAKMVSRMQSAMSTFSADEDKVRAHMPGPLTINICAWGLASAAVCIFVSDAFDPPGAIEWLLALGGMVVLLLGVALDMTIIYFNRPGFLVPPHLRWEPGFRQGEAARLNEVSKRRAEKAVRALYDSHRESWAVRAAARGREQRGAH
jgi:hypothetical protein